MALAEKDHIKCNCTVCGSRFRIKVDRQGNVNHEATYCTFCRAMLEDVEDSLQDSLPE
jgi:hypothetical protein